MQSLQSQDTPKKDLTSGKKKYKSHFLESLFALLEAREHIDLIFWSKDGCSFYITNPDLFAERVLPALYKHNNLSSFIRQVSHDGIDM